ncbi:PQQ-binding-like beta-propeller repeat protein [Verrucomicrobiales bacterium BCK34]|nr:PQQ-binding-like beta-propeller repeat protein [Verrucomicrobiales bacterium BCK34]
MKTPALVFTTTLLVILHSGAFADFWPEFRGPGAEGHAPDAKVPLKWSETKNIRWKTPVDGKAWSSPVIAEKAVFVSTGVVARNKLSLEARAYALDSGKELWKTVIFEGDEDKMHQKNSHASPTPVFRDGKLYVHFGHNGTACLNAADGKVIWTQESITYAPVHGTGGSPVLVGDKLIFSCDGNEDPFVIALDANDGSEAWRTPRGVEVSRTFSFSTPLLIEVKGKQQVVLPGSGAVISYDPETGKEIWRCGYDEGYSVVPRPIYNNGIIYVCSGFNTANLIAVRADGSGDVTDTHIVWTAEKRIPRESSPIIVDGLLFINDDKGILSCFDATTGEEYYQERLNGEGGFSSSPVYASGHLFFHNGEGVTTVVKPGKKFDKVGENELNEFGLSSFAVVSDGFIVRTEENLIRIGER